MEVKIKNKLTAYYRAINFAEKHGNKKKLIALKTKLMQLEKQFWTLYINSRRSLFDLSGLPSVIYKDVVLFNVISDKYEIEKNRINLSVGLSAGNYDIYNSGYPLITDKEITVVDTSKTTQRANVLLPKKHPKQDTSNSLPKGTLINTDNYFSIELTVPKPSKKARKRNYKTIVRRDKKGVLLKKRYKIDSKEYHYLRGGLIKTVNRIPIQRYGNNTYITIDKFRTIVDYLESITMRDLYNEIIRTSVRCQHCNRRATIKQRENSLGCSQCARVGYTVKNYRIRYFYVNSFIRYELNELTGKVRKQIETARGFNTIMQGTINH